MENKHSPSAIFTLVFATLLWGGSALYFNLIAPKRFQQARDGAEWKPAPGGLVPDTILTGGPVDRAGIRMNDTLLLANGVSVASDGALQQVIDRVRTGLAARYTVRRGDHLVQLEVFIERGWSEIVLHWLFKLAGFLYIFMGIFVFFRKPEREKVGIFLIFTSVAGWLLAVGSVNASWLAPTPKLVFYLMLSFNVFFVSPFSLDFFRRLMFFPPGSPPPQRLTLLTYLPGLAGLALFLTPVIISSFQGKPDLFVEEGLWRKIQRFSVPGVMAVYLVWFMSELFMRFSKKQQVINPRQGKWLGLGTGIPMAIFILFDQILKPVLNLPVLQWAQLMLLIPPFVLSYLILKERLLDVGVVIKRSVIYAILSALLIGTFVVLIMAISELVVFVTGQESKLAIFAAALLTAVVGNLYREKTQNYLDRKFFKERHDYQKSLLEFSKDLSQLQEVEPLLAKVSCEFAGALHLSNCLPYVYDQRTDAYVMIAPYCLSDPQLLKVRYSASEFGLTTLLVKERRPLEFYDLETNPLFTHLPVAEKVALKKTDTAVAVPLLVKEKLVGMLHLGNKKSGDYFNPEDLDFFATLTASLAVAVENARLYKEELEKREMERELDVARQIQERLVASCRLPKIPGLDLATTYQPSKQVSGDLFSVIPTKGNQLALAVGDVSGKGIPASLLMATVQATLSALVEQKLAPMEIMQRLNRLVHENSQPEHFVTFFFGLYDLSTRQLTYVNAGHNPPLYFPANGSPKELSEGGLLLGMFPENHYETGQLVLQPLAPLVFYTDGVTEAENHAEEQFGVSRLAELIREQSHLPAELLGERILASVRQFCDGRELGDDLTLVILKAV